MRTRIRALACALAAFAAVPAAAAQTPDAPAAPAGSAKEVQPAESRLLFYGFIRQDVIVDDGRPDSAQTPSFILSPTPGGTNGTYTMHPRLTRFGFNLAGPALAPLGGARISGKLEIDFQNGGRESRAIPRYRHAFMTLSWTSGSVLLGQTWDLISPLFPSVNADTLMWNAGNLGDRRPQIRATYGRTRGRAQWSVAAAAGLTGAVDQQDLDADGVRDGEAAAFPTLQGRAGLTYPRGARRMGVGIWAHVSGQETGTPVGGRTSFDSQAAGLDLEVPIGSRAIVRGEAWTGSNLSDIRGGIGQAINRTTGEEIGSRGGWLELGGDVTSGYALFAGYTIDSPGDEVPAGGRTRNSAWFVTNRFSIARPVVFGIDYLRWTTEYRGLPSGTDHRVNAYATYSF